MKMQFISISAVMALLLSCIPSANATTASYDDFDDIYYTPSKAKNTQKSVSDKETDTPAVSYNYEDPAKTIISTPGLDMDVDTYNRRGQFLVADTIDASNDSISDTYAYTRRIERFHNGDIVSGSGDQDLIYTYYSEPEVNVYVINASPWSAYGYYNPWSPWPYRPIGWNSWYYGPSWSWGFYDPWYSWSWGWSNPAWGWGPGWGWRPPVGGRPGMGVPPPPGRPGNGGWAVNSPGASRPHPSVSGNSSSSSANRPGAFSAGARNASRPGNLGRGRANNGYGNQTARPSNPSRPESGTTHSRPNSSANPQKGSTPPRQNGNTSANPQKGSTPPRQNGTSSNSGSHSNRNSFNNGNQSRPANNSSHSSGSSFGSGRPSHGTSGGAGRSGGGSSGGRGRR